MSRKLALPMSSLSPLAATPTVEVMRAKLGGRSHSEPGAGELVRVGDGAGPVGVVLHVRGDELDVLVGAGIVHRTRREAATTVSDHDAPRALSAIAGDARSFAAVREGQAVHYEDALGAVQRGVVAEKCRYGALVVTPDSRTVAVGFRKVWPVPDAASRAPN